MMGRVICKALLLVAPLMALLGLELFILPLDAFTFRVWESVAVHGRFLPGPFYPNVRLFKFEEGDLGYRTRFAVRKPVYWETDSYGYRRAINARADCPVAIIGDSAIAGSGLTQDDTLASVLENRLGIGVYPFAPSDFRTFTRDPRIQARTPIVVVLSAVERNIGTLQTLSDTRFRRRLADFRTQVMKFAPLRDVAVQVDRAMKSSGLHYVRAQVAGRADPVERGGFLFLEGPSANRPKPQSAVDAAVVRIRYFDRWCRDRGARFILLPIPNKENIYHDLFPGQVKPTFLRDLHLELSRQGIESIDTQSAFERARAAEGQSLYLRDDTHWSPEAVRLTADLLADAIGPASGPGRSGQ